MTNGPGPSLSQSSRVDERDGGGRSEREVHKGDGGPEVQDEENGRRRVRVLKSLTFWLSEKKSYVVPFVLSTPYSGLVVLLTLVPRADLHPVTEEKENRNRV